MHNDKLHDSAELLKPSATAFHGFRPRISTREVFEQLIEVELRSGRLTPGRRRRIVRYAARLGLSAVEAGRFVEQCRDQALTGADPVERAHALRLVSDPKINAGHVGRIALAAVGTLLWLLLWGW